MAEGFSAAREAGMDFCGFLYGLKPVPFRICRCGAGFGPHPAGRWNRSGVGFPRIASAGADCIHGLFSMASSGSGRRVPQGLKAAFFWRVDVRDESRTYRCGLGWVKVRDESRTCRGPCPFWEVVPIASCFDLVLRGQGLPGCAAGRSFEAWPSCLSILLIAAGRIWASWCWIGRGWRNCLARAVRAAFLRPS